MSGRNKDPSFHSGQVLNVYGLESDASINLISLGAEPVLQDTVGEKVKSGLFIG